MILDMYQYFKNSPQYFKLVGSDYMIIEYKCPIESEKLQLFNEVNFITYIISGKKDWITPSRIFHVKEGDAIFVKKGVHTVRQYFEVDHCVLLFFMKDEFIRTFMMENQSAGHSRTQQPVDDPIFPLDVNDTLKSLFFSVFNYLKMGTDIPRPLVEMKFRELLFNIILNPNHKRLVDFFSSLGSANKSNLEEVMLKNFQHDLSMGEFARLCGRSLSAFKRDFQNLFQQTPGKWLIDRRLEFACALLVNSDLNVNQICEESGFKDASHFNKSFKAKYKLPPKQFRVNSKPEALA